MHLRPAARGPAPRAARASFFVLATSSASLLGWPGDRSLAALRDIEGQLEERLGASGRLVAHESAGGVRLWHVYVDSTGSGADVVRSTVAGWGEGSPVVRAEYDPAWQGIAHLVT